jgi:predicted GIY-YIG superfamily endonuclease
VEEEEDENKQYAVLPYVRGVHNKISRVLKMYKINCIFVPNKKIKQMLKTPKDTLNLKIPGVYKIKCECGTSYIGQTGRTVECRQKEHIRALKYGYTEKSTVAEHSIEQKHKILFEETKILHVENRILNRMVLESIEIELNGNNINKENGFPLSDRWKVLLKATSTSNREK